eukprot:SAG31_NODE_3105_length_4668_cov_1.437733_1_plen_253_part_00
MRRLPCPAAAPDELIETEYLCSDSESSSEEDDTAAEAEDGVQVADAEGGSDRFRAVSRSLASMVGGFIALPPVSRIWTGVLIATTVLCFFQPAAKESLALHWRSVHRGELWRLASTFCAFGGVSVSTRTLLSLWFLFDGAVVYEQLLRFSSRISRPTLMFLTTTLLGAALLVAGQWFGVQKGLYKAAGMHFLTRRLWLSHDLSFFLFCSSCWCGGAYTCALHLFFFSCTAQSHACASGSYHTFKSKSRRCRV